MKTLKVLQVRFDAQIAPYEVAAFRGAVIDKVGRKNTLLFHHHLSKEQYLYQYPLIQYKALQGNPTILCLDEGVDEIHKFFENQNWDIVINNRFLKMKIANLYLNQFKLNVWQQHFHYCLFNWVALNSHNYQYYKQLNRLAERANFLESILIGNILSFAKGVNWEIEADKQIEVQIMAIVKEKYVSYKQNKVMAFDLNFSTNVFLPNYIGLGRNSSLGFGIIKTDKLRD